MTRNSSCCFYLNVNEVYLTYLGKFIMQIMILNNKITKVKLFESFHYCDCRINPDSFHLCDFKQKHGLKPDPLV